MDLPKGINRSLLVLACCAGLCFLYYEIHFRHLCRLLFGHGGSYYYYTSLIMFVVGNVAFFAGYYALKYVISGFMSEKKPRPQE